MSRILNSFLFTIPSSKWKFWVLMALIAKGSILIFYLGQDRSHGIEGFYGFVSGDSESYLEPTENLLTKGTYEPDYRMPGYSAFYLPFYYFFPKAAALNILILIQVILSAASVYYLALVSKFIFKSDIYFYFTFYTFAISTYSSLFDGIILTESLATSLLIICIYTLLKWEQTLRMNWLFLSGCILTEVIFLRPVFAPLWIILVIYILRNASGKTKTLTVLFFILPFLIVDGLWVTRNYIKHGKASFLTTSLYYPESKTSVWGPVSQFVQSWGGNITFWEAGAEIRWFGYGTNKNLFKKGVKTDADLPNYIYTSKFNQDSLSIIKAKVLTLINDSTLNEKTAEDYKTYITNRLNLYTNSIKKEKPFLYYVKAPLFLIKKFFFHSGTYNLFNKSGGQLNLVELIIKVFYSFFYWFVLITGLTGVIFLLKNYNFFHGIILVITIIVYTALIHPVVLRLCEARYFVPSWPFLIICSVYFVIWAYNLARKKT